MTATRSAGTPTRGRSADGQVVGGLLVLAGIVWLLQRAGAVHLSWEAMLSGLLIALGAGMVITARRSRGRGLILLGLTLTLVLAGTSSVNVGLATDGVGTRTRHPPSLAAAAQAPSLGIGHLEVDLAGLDVPVGESALSYRIGIGEMIIRLPADSDIGVRVVAKARGGDLSVLEQRRQGSNITLPYTTANYATAERKLVLTLNAGLGSIQVDRGG